MDLDNLVRKQKDFEKQEKGLVDSGDSKDFVENQTNSETLLKMGQYMSQLKQIDPPQIVLVDEEMIPQTQSYRVEVKNLAVWNHPPDWVDHSEC